tara:strand:+ start:1138 stop:1719 length:582 start_codon:yes stop_codon:yes gene_type:complete
MIEKMIYLPIALLIISNIFFATKYFKRKRKKKKNMSYEVGGKIKEPYNVTNAHSKANYHTIMANDTRCKNLMAISNDRLDKLEVDVAFISDDRLDKLEVDVAFIKDHTIKQKAIVLRKRIKDVVENKGINKNTFKPKKKPRKQKKRMFTEMEIDQEMRKELGTILFLTNDQLKLQEIKAYRRLWYKANKNKNK